MGQCKLGDHNILIQPGVHPISRKPRKLTPAMQTALREILDELLQHGAIEGCKSAWASNVVLVPKPNGKYRMCIDYREVNQVTVRDAYPMQRVDDALRALEGAQCFACIDLKSGFHQIRVTETSRDYTAFCTPFGLYRFKVMPFGLCNAPATFQRMVDMLFDDYRFRGLGAYMDDIVVYAKTHAELRDLLEIVYERLLYAGLYANIEKMHVGYTELEYLGFIISKHGIHPDPSKIQAIAHLTRPPNVQALRRFLGAVGFFRKFIRAFAAKADPLTRLLRKATPWQWEEAQESAWTNLRNALTLKPIILAHADPSLRYYLDTDASGIAVGAALLQKDLKARMRVIAYASKSLGPTERLWPAREREAFAIFYGITHFASYLRGAPEFTIRTDHESLTWLWAADDKKLTRWRLALAEYEFVIHYRKGAKHHLPDLLSRDVPAIIPDDTIDNRICLSRHVFLAINSPPPFPLNSPTPPATTTTTTEVSPSHLLTRQLLPPETARQVSIISAEQTDQEAQIQLTQSFISTQSEITQELTRQNVNELSSFIDSSSHTNPRTALTYSTVSLASSHIADWTHRLAEVSTIDPSTNTSLPALSRLLPSLSTPLSQSSSTTPPQHYPTTPLLPLPSSSSSSLPLLLSKPPVSETLGGADALPTPATYPLSPPRPPLPTSGPLFPTPSRPHSSNPPLLPISTTPQVLATLGGSTATLINYSTAQLLPSLSTPLPTPPTPLPPPKPSWAQLSETLGEAPSSLINYSTAQLIPTSSATISTHNPPLPQVSETLGGNTSSLLHSPTASLLPTTTSAAPTPLSTTNQVSETLEDSTLLLNPPTHSASNPLRPLTLPPHSLLPSPPSLLKLPLLSTPPILRTTSPLPSTPTLLLTPPSLNTPHASVTHSPLPQSPHTIDYLTSRRTKRRNEVSREGPGPHKAKPIHISPFGTSHHEANSPEATGEGLHGALHENPIITMIPPTNHGDGHALQAPSSPFCGRSGMTNHVSMNVGMQVASGPSFTHHSTSATLRDGSEVPIRDRERRPQEMASADTLLSHPPYSPNIISLSGDSAPPYLPNYFLRNPALPIHTQEVHVEIPPFPTSHHPRFSHPPPTPSTTPSTHTTQKSTTAKQEKSQPVAVELEHPPTTAPPTPPATTPRQQQKHRKVHNRRQLASPTQPADQQHNTDKAADKQQESSQPVNPPTPLPSNPYTYEQLHENDSAAHPDEPFDPTPLTQNQSTFILADNNTPTTVPTPPNNHLCAASSQPLCLQAIARAHQDLDPDFICKHKLTKHAQLWHNEQGAIYIPNHLQEACLYYFHFSKYGLHMSANKMHQRMRALCWWPSIGNDTNTYVARCLVCSRRLPRPSRQQLGDLITIRPGMIVSIDGYGPFTYLGTTYTALTMIDHYTKWAEVVAWARETSVTARIIWAAFFSPLDGTVGLPISPLVRQRHCSHKQIHTTAMHRRQYSETQIYLLPSPS
eukprot:GHVU01060542.1.p1 GENE.GHVU01060542.1~~GHVU01060542.1.p1  ORF type:complete len:1666 (-),score=155.90 GHVU01060542.1:1257-5648(-)